ncbi:hypothetical protein BP5796_12023 [Coleophoma crateriformis]|uniref:Zn(2)-C6 fungal-type domain-containing protein n=1 Tax=Coleophoma crateriformis TaxID=565419 RepID=A0A3D8QBE7_9HELO|nr:hypothetical protein BP5796_12023 [Coleophoma crateriformis]
MVNNGASGACYACKQRHKKCDETRPSCLRCSRAHRQCPGYNASRELKFVNYAGETTCELAHQQSASLLHHSTHIDVHEWPAIKHNARSAFFNDYCITSKDQTLSRGYLNGLETMITKAGPTSEVAKACTIIALASLGKKVGDPMFLHAAENLHSLLLRSFRLSISNETASASVESLITAVLLGLYEIITSTDAYHGAHIAHARGISAILISKQSPFDLVCGGKLFQLSNPLPLEDLDLDNSGLQHLQYSLMKDTKVSPIFSVLCTPLVKQSNTTIESIFIQTASLILRARSLIADEATTIDQLYCLKLDAEQLDERYNAWSENIPDEWQPRSVGVITLKNDETTPPAGYWPGTISSYKDAYIASIWDGYRKARLMVLEIILDCYKRINTSHYLEVDSSIHKKTEELIGGIVSSIPYFLAADLQVFLKNSTTGTPSIVPGRPVGGLLLMNTLWALMTISMVEPRLKSYLKDCLAWVGNHMGLGQATILSKVRYR